MAMQEAVHKRNIESAILFMQQEHAATLKALHEEIRQLQKKCSDLTFELNMAGLDIHEGVPPEVVDHIKHLEKMIDSQRETQHELEVELDKKDKLIKENEYTYKRQKMKHIEELRAKNKEVEELRAQLDAAANSNAYYQNELLKIKREKFHHATQGASHLPEGAVHAPAPPKDSKSNPKRSFHIRRTLGDTSKEEVGDLPPVLPGSGAAVRGSSGGTSRSDSPAELIKPFLRSDDAEKEVIQIKSSNPLPPIRTSSGRVIFREPVDVVQVSVHNVPKPLIPGKKAVSTTQEVETLAVGQVSHSNSAWKHHRKESHSSEYR